nr:MAG TPA: hypothetical protein [Caudoviricetes sp.]
MASISGGFRVEAQLEVSWKATRLKHIRRFSS